jgi:hypothetical protein
MTKRFTTPLLIAMVIAALFSGALSARQLSLRAQSTTCRGFCDKKVRRCPNVLGCGCVIQPGFTTGVCDFIAAKPAR